MDPMRVTRRGTRAAAWTSIVLSTTSCGSTVRDILEDAGEQYQRLSISPATTATFAYEDFFSCGGLGGLSRDSPPADLFIGAEAAGVGDAGTYKFRSGYHLKRARTHVLFDVRAIPPASADSVLAVVYFGATRTPLSDRGDLCPLPEPIGRSAAATSVWWESADFRLSSLIEDSRALRPDRCILTEGEYGCEVSETVRSWIRGDVRSPNLGLIVFGPEDDYRTSGLCETQIGYPGDHLECAAELTNIRLDIAYIP